MVTAREKRLAPLRTPTSLSEEATRDISAALTGLLADVFALYIKTKNFHWHVRGRHFHDLHLLFDTQATEIFALTDLIAERVRKQGGNTLTSPAAALFERHVPARPGLRSEIVSGTYP